jgi:nitrogen fixation NifU-like protein
MAEQLPYSQKVMDHFTNPRNVGEIVDASGIGTVGNPVCGDVMKMYLKIENDVIVDIKFKTFGCGAAVATSSMVTEMVKGKTITQALTITNNAVAEALGGLPAKKMHCSVLAEEALRSALKDYYKKQGKPVPFEDKGHRHEGETCL